MKDTIKPITFLMIRARVKKETVIKTLSACFNRPRQVIEHVYTSMQKTHVHGCTPLKIITKYEINDVISKLETKKCGCANLLREELLNGN